MNEAPMHDDTIAPPRIRLREIFVSFLSMGLSGFGGVLPWAYRILVERRRWVTAGEFTRLLSLCQFLPGPNIANLTVFLGVRFRGLTGAVVAFIGLMLMPFAIILALAVLYDNFGSLPDVHDAFRGVAAAAAGLVTATAIKMAKPFRVVPRAVVFGGLVFVAIGVLRLPLHWVILGVAPLSILWVWMRSDG
jgi:chromate transporter